MTTLGKRYYLCELNSKKRHSTNHDIVRSHTLALSYSDQACCHLLCLLLQFQMTFCLGHPQLSNTNLTPLQGHLVLHCCTPINVIMLVLLWWQCITMDFLGTMKGNEAHAIDTCSHTSRQCLLESWVIHKESNLLNRGLGPLPHSYKTFIIYTPQLLITTTQINFIHHHLSYHQLSHQ